MKRTAMIATALILATPTFAGTFTETEQQKCETIAESAETIMKARQNGIGMDRLMQAVKDSTEKGSRSLYQKMVGEAYQQPDWSQSQLRQKSIQDFKDKWYRKCYLALSSDEET